MDYYLLKNQIKIIWFFIILFLYIPFSYWFSWSLIENTSKATIKELKENIEDLNKNKIELTKETEKLNKNDKLKSFFKNNLNKKKIKQITLIINDYKKSKFINYNKLLIKAKNLENIEDEKNILLSLKKELYKKLIPYIENNEIENYLEYIKWDAKLLKEKKDITWKIIINKELLNQKVNKIEEQIKKNKEIINNNFTLLVEKKINKKIYELENRDDFKSINNKSKKKIIDNTIIKIKLKISDLEKNRNLNKILLKKLEIYKLLLLKFEEYMLKIESQ